jgi:ubiquitin carboxyl-terminal hydrolase 34
VKTPRSKQPATHINYTQAREFLETIRLPAESRSRVVSSPATADELFPKDRQHRSLFSLFILRTHLSDLARLGLTDRGFALRAAHLLTAVILDKERKFDAHLMLEVLQTLSRVLQGDRLS